MKLSPSMFNVLTCLAERPKRGSSRRVGHVTDPVLPDGAASYTPSISEPRGNRPHREKCRIEIRANALMTKRTKTRSKPIKNSGD
jgi:hypothetical protein